MLSLFMFVQKADSFSAYVFMLMVVYLALCVHFKNLGVLGFSRSCVEKLKRD